ncbi:MAG: Hsp70 family protein, partial [Planctomycetes bacterium]|nr:Hsp70 family protein [Planctomycetota bacterium]
MPPIIGVDLGTTYSLCAVFEDGAARLLRNPLGSVLTPSAVGLLPDGRHVVGEPARELMVLRPERACAFFKRWMGTDRRATLGERTFTAQELSSMVLRSLKEDAERALATEVVRAVITVPAYFNELQRQATRAAGHIAGLEVTRILNEPSAAALAYGVVDPTGDKTLLVIDLGGGTFDVTLMNVFEGTLEIVATAGESRLGGEDFTDRIVQWRLEQAGLQLEIEEVRNPRRVQRQRVLAERGKRGIATPQHIPLASPDGSIDAEAGSVVLDESHYAELVQPLLARLRQPIDRALRDGRTTRDQIDEVVLAGGATRDPLVRALVEGEFGRVPRCSLNPD